MEVFKYFQQSGIADTCLAVFVCWLERTKLGLVTAVSCSNAMARVTRANSWRVLCRGIGCLAYKLDLII